MRHLIPQLLLIVGVMVAQGCHESRQPVVAMKKLLRPEDVPWGHQGRDSTISLHITFLPGNAETLWCDLSNGTPALEFCITNLSDSSLAIEPFHLQSLSSNPILIFEQDGEELSPLNLTHQDFLPLRFVDIMPRRSICDTVTSFNYDLTPGRTYRIHAMYSSRWGGYVDERDILHRVWSGRLSSNVLLLRTRPPK
jgi:hypothetical protein